MYACKNGYLLDNSKICIPKLDCPDYNTFNELCLNDPQTCGAGCHTCLPQNDQFCTSCYSKLPNNKLYKGLCFNACPSSSTT
jgi:hypothetical protein